MACSQTLIGIPYDCSTNIGGIKEVYLTNYADNIFTTGSTESGDEVVSGVSSGATFYRYQFRKGTGSMTSTLNADEAAGVNYVSTELVLQFSRMETAKRTAVAALALGGLAGIVVDCNNKKWAIGVDEPVNATAGSGNTGTARTDSNNYGITLTDEYKSFPLEVSDEAFASITIAQ